jgi:hypothetical protein
MAKVPLSIVLRSLLAIGPLKLCYCGSLQLCQRDRRPILTNPLGPSVNLSPSVIPLILLGPLAAAGLHVLFLLQGDDHEKGTDADAVAVVVDDVDDGDDDVVVVVDAAVVVAAAAVTVTVAVVEPHPQQDMKCTLVGQVRNAGSQIEELALDSLYSRTISH